MTTTIIAVANQKGGVGKTTIALALATAFADLMHGDTLFVDLDTQANGTVGLGHRPDAGVGRWLAMDDPLASVTISIRDHLYLVPGSSKTDIANIYMSTENRIGLLHERLAAEATGYHYVVVDCPPNLSAITKAALIAADIILVPIDCEFFALQGVATLAYIVQGLNGNHVGRLAGIIPNKYRQVNVHADNVAKLKEKFGNLVWDPLPLTTQVARTQELYQSLWMCSDVDARHKAAWASMVKKVLSYV